MRCCSVVVLLGCVSSTAALVFYADAYSTNMVTGITINADDTQYSYAAEGAGGVVVRQLNGVNAYDFKGEVAAPPQDDLYSVAYARNRVLTVYTCGTSGSLYETDVSDPTTPTFLGNSPADARSKNCKAMATMGNHVYTCTEDVASKSVLGIYDVTVKGAPVFVKAVALISRCVEVAVVEATQQLFILCDQSGLFIYDVADPIAPDRTKFVESATTQEARGMTYSDGHIFVTYSGEFSFFDLTGYLISTYACPSCELMGIAHKPPLAFISSGEVDEVKVFEVTYPSSTPSNLVELQSLSMSYTANAAVAVGGDFVYLGMSQGAEVYESKSTTAPATEAPGLPPPTAAPDTVTPQTPATGTGAPAPPTDAPDTPTPPALPTTAPDTATPMMSFSMTLVPETTAPPTPPPVVAAQTTAVPVPGTAVPTSIPATATPNAASTAIPETPVTGAPETALSPTDAPATDVVAVTLTTPPQRDTGAPTPTQPAIGEQMPKPDPNAGTRKDTQDATLGVALASSLGGFSGAGAALRLGLTGAPCRITTDNVATGARLPFALHPTQWQPWETEMVGVVLGNCIICAGVAVVAFATFCTAAHAVPHFGTHSDLAGTLRLPSLPLFVFRFLFQGTTLGAFTLLLQGPSIIEAAAAVLVLTVCVVVPIYVAQRLHRDTNRYAHYVNYVEDTGSMVLMLLGPGEWVSKYSRIQWVNRYASVLRAYRDETVWYSAVDLGFAFALSAVKSVQTENTIQCGHVQLAVSLLCLCYGMAVSILLPYARPRDTFVDIVVTGMQGTATLTLAVGHYREDPPWAWGYEVAGLVLLLAAVVLVVKAVLDIVSEALRMVRMKHLLPEQQCLERAPSEVSCQELGFLVAHNLGASDVSSATAHSLQDLMHHRLGSNLLGGTASSTPLTPSLM